MSNGPGTDHVRYVIAVHGIGDQRKNETVLDVINRFAEIRRGVTKRQKGDPLTLGVLSSQTANINPLTGKPWPWIEFEGIPRTPPAPGAKLPPFLGRHVINSDGDNIRFVDIHWAKIMRDQFPEVGQDVASWSSSLIERLKNNPDCPKWALRLLTIMRKAVSLVQKVMNLKFPSLAVKIFNDFLGDVQLYGEYGPCRGQGVRKFHELMGEAQAAHNLEQAERKKMGKTPKEARYTIIAHSLGTIMSLDALLYACADPARGLNQGPHFEGYLKEKEKQDPLDSTKEWITNVDSFVTLGSPIDKYLVVWWLNYEYLIQDSWIIMPKRDDKEHKIRHFNYSDEQDPVGGELDVASTAPAIDRLFRNEKDVVFTRYPIPAVAHVEYWNDLPLFKEILDRAVDSAAQETERSKGLKIFKLSAYLHALRVNYFYIPLFFWLVLTFSLTVAFNKDSLSKTLTSGAVFLGVLYIGRLLFHFIIEGRQVIISKVKSHSRARTMATFILPLIYLFLAGVIGWFLQSRYLGSLFECAQKAEWRVCLRTLEQPAVLALWNVRALDIFLSAVLGEVVVLYGLCVYFYYKLRNWKIEKITSYKEYVEASRSTTGG